MKQRNAVIVGLLGAVVGLLVLLTFQLHAVPDAQGQAAAASGINSDWLMTSATSSGGRAVVFLFNTKDVKLAMYMSTGTAFNLQSVRLCTFDFQLIQYPTAMRPSVQQVRDMVKKQK